MSNNVRSTTDNPRAYFPTIGRGANGNLELHYDNLSNTPLNRGLWAAIPMADGGGTIYWSVEGDFMHFYFHRPDSETGFGGSTMVLEMQDGSTVKIKGPWSGSSSSINRYLPLHLHVVECTYRSKEGYSMSGHVLIAAARREGVELAPVRAPWGEEGAVGYNVLGFERVRHTYRLREAA
jgi:hypothetical protein